MKAQCQIIRLVIVLAAVMVVSALGSGRAAGQTITEIIGAGLLYPRGIAVDTAGNAYVTGLLSNNAFKITPDGFITEIIDATGDGMGNGLDNPYGIAVDAAGNAYVTGLLSNNAFKVTPDGVITEIIDVTGDGMSNGLGNPYGIAVDATGNAYVTGLLSNNAFKITPDCNTNGIPDDQDIANCDLNDPACADCNANGIPDECEPDADDDGVPDNCELCPDTIPDSPVDENGCPPVIPGDFNHDGDVDNEDYDQFEACATGPAVPLTPGCEDKDFDHDNDGDQSDFGIFQRCMSGPNVPADPNCAN